MGMSSPEWSRYMHDVVGLDDPPDEIAAEVVRRMEARYRESLPLLRGASEAVERLAARWPLGLASSSNRPLIDLALELAQIDRLFAATVSSEEVRARKARTRRLRGGRAAGSASLPPAPPRSRTRAAGSAPRTRRAFASSRSRTRTSRPTRTRCGWPTASYPLSRSWMRTLSILTLSAAALFGASGSHASFPGSNGRLAYFYSAEVWTLGADGSAARSLGAGLSPAWSPNGRLLAFDTVVDRNYDIWTMRPDGTARPGSRVTPRRTTSPRGRRTQRSSSTRATAAARTSS